MALSRFVVTSDVTLAADALTGGTGGWGNTTEAPGSVTGTDAAGHWSTNGPQIIPAGTVVYADSTAGSTGPQLLYQAIGASNLRAYVQGSDDAGHAAVSN